jgi:hypothetical protein
MALVIWVCWYNGKLKLSYLFLGSWQPFFSFKITSGKENDDLVLVLVLLNGKITTTSEAKVREIFRRFSELQSIVN